MVATYTSPQNINIFFMLASIYILFVSIYQLLVTKDLLDNLGDTSQTTDLLIAIPLGLNGFGIILFIFMFIIAILKMTCRTGKNREYVFTLIYTILIILFLSIAAIPINIAILNQNSFLSLDFIQFAYIANVAIIVISAFATVMYTCAICKNDQLDTIQKRLELYDDDKQFKTLVSTNVGKSPQSTFGLKDSAQVKEVCSTNFLPGTLREQLADGELEKDVCASIGLKPNQTL